MPTARCNGAMIFLFIDKKHEKPYFLILRYIGWIVLFVDLYNYFKIILRGLNESLYIRYNIK